MNREQVQVGSEYQIHIGGKPARVRVIAARAGGGWDAINPATNRHVRIKSARRLRRAVYEGDAGKPRDLKSAALRPEERGITIEYARAWLHNETRQGYEASWSSFWRAHGLCPHCCGDGHSFLDGGPCPYCGGNGLLSRRDTKPHGERIRPVVQSLEVAA